MPTITVSGSKLTIGAMKYEGKSISKKTFDLRGFEGKRVRVHIGNDYRYTIGSNPTQKLLICELDVPEKRMITVDTGEKDEFGEPIMETKEQELDLKGVKIVKYV